MINSAEREYLPPHEEEVRLGFCRPDEEICAALERVAQPFNPDSAAQFDWLVIKRPSWFRTKSSKQELDALRERMVSHGKLTVAVLWDDSQWWRVRIEKVDGRSHVVAFGGEGGEWSRVRLIGYENEKLVPFVFLSQRNGLDPETGTTPPPPPPHLFIMNSSLLSCRWSLRFHGRDVSGFK
jgi:hypothetical protein